MSYHDIKISGDIVEALEAWVVREYGNMVDIEVGGINEDEFAAVGYAAVANEGSVEAIILLIQHDPEGGPDHYRLKDMVESEGPIVDFCPERILDQLTPTEDHMANHWRERCRERAGQQSAPSAFSLNS